MVEFFENIFSPIVDLLGAVLVYFHGHGIPWWLSIVFLTVIVRSLLFPLTIKQVQSMRAMQELKPEMDKIREKYRDNVQKQREEQAKLFQERKINPLGGCLPILLQMPIFIGMFYVIREFGGSQGMIGVPDTTGTKPGFTDGGLFWFQNLSMHDPIYILPVLSALAMIAGMEITARKMENQQKWIMRILPIAFTVIIARFPAGLQLYVVTTNLMTLLQNYLIYEVGPKLKTKAAARSDGENLESGEATGERSSSHNPPTRTERNREMRKRRKKKGK